MGFFDFIKKILKEEPKEEPKLETVKLSELPAWIEKKSRSVSDSLNDEIKLVNEKIKAEIESTKENLKKLESAELRNPNISLKEKQFMKGNREAYVKRVGILTGRIELPDSPKQVMSFCADFDRELQSFEKSTARPYHILKEFFGHESRDIALNIKNIDQAKKELKSIIQGAGLDRVEKIKSDIQSLMNSINQKKEYTNKVKQEKQNLEELKSSKLKTQQEINDFKKGSEFSAYEKLKQDKYKAAKELDEHRKQLWHSFNILERAMKKFQRIAFDNQELIERYAKDPVAALHNDKSFKIIDILARLKENTASDKLDLKDKKKDKTIAEIKKLNQEFFAIFSNKDSQLKEKFDEIKTKLEENQAEQKLSELSRNIEKTAEEIQSLTRTMEASKNELEKIDIDKLKSGIKKEIENMNIRISIQE